MDIKRLKQLAGILEEASTKDVAPDNGQEKQDYKVVVDDKTGAPKVSDEKVITKTPAVPPASKKTGKSIKEYMEDKNKLGLTSILEDIDKGAFHRWLGKKETDVITDADIERGLSSKDKHVNKMAQFAKNMREE